MTEYFLVKKSIDGLRKDGEWQDVSIKAVLEAFALNDKTVDLYLTREDAEAAALDGVDFENDTDFFPIARVEVPDHLKGRATEVELEDGSILQTRTFNNKHVKVTHIYLSHIEKGYDDINLVEDELSHSESPDASASESHASLADDENEVEEVDVEIDDEKPVAVAPVEAKPSKLSILVRFMPAPSLTNAKNVLGLAGMGAAYYFGNGAVADLVAKTGYAIPEIVTSNAGASVGIPVAAGLATRAVTEVAQLLFQGVASAGKGIANLCKAGKAKWDARKAAAKPAVAPDAGSAQISQLTAALEQFNDVSEEHSGPQEQDKAITYSKQADSSASLRELIPQKTTANPKADAVKPTFH